MRGVVVDEVHGQARQPLPLPGLLLSTLQTPQVDQLVEILSESVPHPVVNLNIEIDFILHRESHVCVK